MTTGLITLQKDFEEIKPFLRELLEKVDDLRNIIEAASATIISEMKKCPCNREILDALENSKKSENQIIPLINEVRSGRLLQYSYPNNNVGNEELGTGKNPNSISWPPKKHESR